MLNISNASLREIDAHTQGLIREWRNQSFIRLMMFSQDIISEESHKQWLASIKNNPQKYVKIFFYDEVPLGVVTFNKVNDALFEWGFYIGEQSAPKGMGTILGVVALDYYFSKVNSHKLCAEVLSYNEKSLAFHEKLGFVSEGILRKHYQQKNDFYDVHLFGIFKDEWVKKRAFLLNCLKRGENNE